MGTLLLLAGSGTAAAQGRAAPAPRPGAAEPSAALLAEGKQVYESVCTGCHSMESPATLAPPMTHVAKHYRQAFSERDSAVAHIITFVRNPAAERSKMPAHVQERFGLMPALPLPDEQLRAVATYIWSLPDPAAH